MFVINTLKKGQVSILVIIYYWGRKSHETNLIKNDPQHFKVHAKPRQPLLNITRYTRHPIPNPPPLTDQSSLASIRWETPGKAPLPPRCIDTHILTESRPSLCGPFSDSCCQSGQGRCPVQGNSTVCITDRHIPIGPF